MPNVIRFNSQGTDKYANLAALFGKSTAEDFAVEVENLRSRVGNPASFREAGVDEKAWNEKLDTMVENALKDPCTLFNPIKPDAADIKAIYEACYAGVSVNAIAE